MSDWNTVVKVLGLTRPIAELYEGLLTDEQKQEVVAALDGPNRIHVMRELLHGAAEEHKATIDEDE